jgi:hypothetical protein
MTDGSKEESHCGKRALANVTRSPAERGTFGHAGMTREGIRAERLAGRLAERLIYKEKRKGKGKDKRHGTKEKEGKRDVEYTGEEKMLDKLLGEMEPGKEKGERDSRRRIWIALIILLALAIGVFTAHQLGYLSFPWEKEAPPIVAGNLFPGEGDAENGHLSNMTPEQIKEQMQKVVDENYLSFKINSRPVFSDGNAEGTLGIENPNNNAYPLVITIELDDTGEKIYDSGGIMPDHHIDTAKLSKVLEKGEYKATATINAYDPDTKELKGRQAAALIITVEN